MTTNDNGWTTGRVCIDELVSVPAQYMPENRWNGFIAAPYIDALSVVMVLEAINADADTYGEELGGYDFTWDADGALVLTNRQELAETGDAFRPEVIRPDEDGLYALGSYGWVWSEDADPHWHYFRPDIKDIWCEECQTVTDYCQQLNPF